MSLPPGVPPEAVPFLEQMNYFGDEVLAVGDKPPVLTLSNVAGTDRVSIGGEKRLPNVLIFGSYT